LRRQIGRCNFFMETVILYRFAAASIDARPPRSLLFRFEKVVVDPYTGNQIVPTYQSEPLCPSLSPCPPDPYGI
jgi:hypothetical protein